jgi:hypothetical protein
MTRVFVRNILLLVLVSTLSCAFPTFAVETRMLKARVSDIEGRPLEGAKLFLYDSPNVRRPADFISSLSDGTGRIQLVLPPAKYWVVARFKPDGKYGPLMPGDRHSGEPLEVDLSAGGVEADFVVADIREIGQKKRTNATDALRLKGKVVDSQGAPVAQAFVFASRSKEFSEVPDFVSAWTGADGRYEVYLPQGATYYVGASRQFPLEYRQGFFKPLLVERGKIDIAIDIDLTVQ